MDSELILKGIMQAETIVTKVLYEKDEPFDSFMKKFAGLSVS